MSYGAEISRANPTCFLFLIDQSASMSDELESGVSKSNFLADVLNKTLMELVIQCRKAEGILDYFDVGVLAYSGSSVQPAFGGSLSGIHLTQVSAIAKAPLRVETRHKKVPDGAGGLVETEVKFPVWFDPTSGGGTPMCAGLSMAGNLVRDWCSSHSHSFPPTVLHITDGEATDGQDRDVMAAAELVTKQATNDGRALLLTLHVSGAGGDPIKFPAQESSLPNAYAKLLFRMSSTLPTELLSRVVAAGIPAVEGGKGYVFNARMEEVLRFFEIGTRPRLAGGGDR
jgi:hypothetical protein